MTAREKAARIGYMNHRKQLLAVGKKWDFSPEFDKSFPNLWDDLLLVLAAVERETLERAVSIWEHEKHTYCDFYYEGLTELDPRKKPDWMKDE